jgi:STAS-like domain of unknown function (DUF4325)
MNSPHKISVAKDFSTVPLGRFPDDSDFNGTVFREKWLLPALAKHDTLQVDFDGAEGYGSSFLEEAFGGLVRLHGFSPSDLLKRISLISEEDPTLIDEVHQYIQDAARMNQSSGQAKNGPSGS